MSKIRSTIVSDLSKAVEAREAARLVEYKAARVEARAVEAARVRLTRDEIVGATHVRFSWGWREVARVNRSSVSVKTPYSWTDRHLFDAVLEVRTVTP